MAQQIPWMDDLAVSGEDLQWLGEAALECLKQLRCYSPPILPEYFPISANQQVTRRSRVKTGQLKGQGPLGTVSAFHAAKIAASDFFRRKGIGLADGNHLALLDSFSMELLAPTTWLAEIWKNKNPLIETTRLFPCLQGENLALRLARYWSNSPDVVTSWFQGGQRIWSSQGGAKACGMSPNDLEVAAWTFSRDYSRPVLLREHGQEIHGVPFHDGFPKGEVLVLFPSGFHG